MGDANELVDGMMLGVGLLMVFAFFVILIICIFSVICQWKHFKKMGEPGWIALIPFYNSWILCQHVWGNGLFMFAWLIPYAGTFMYQYTKWRMYRGFGKPTAFCVLGLLFVPITDAICAFDDSDFDEGRVE